MTLAFLDDRGPVESARHLHALGLAVLPVARKGKKPVVGEGWQHFRITDSTQIDAQFRGRNVGVLLGEPSGWLVDVDLDAPEALGLAVHFLPKTVAFGRASNPRSHWLYVSEGARYHKLLDPVTHQTIIELRAGTNDSGKQTVFPNSVHESGEPIRFCDGPNQPEHIDAGILDANVRHLGCATLLERYAPDRLVDVMRRVAPVEARTLESRRWLRSQLRVEVAEQIADWLEMPREAVAAPVSRFTGTTDDLREATELFCRAHAREFPANGGECPVCGSSNSFKAIPENPAKWACFSTRHNGTNCGTLVTRGEPHHVGDVLDLAAWAEGVTRVALLRSVGILVDRQRPEPPKPAPQPQPAPAAPAPAKPAEADALSVAALLPTFLLELMHGVPRLRTHFRELDKKLDGGIPLRGLTVLGGEPKAGKSTLAQRIAIEHVRNGGIALYYDFENGAPRFLRRMLCAEAEVGPSALRVGLTPAEQRRFEAAQRTVMGPLRELYVQTDRRTTPEDLRRDVVTYLQRAGDRPLLVVIDSIQKLHVADLGERRAAIDAWLRDLEALKNEHNIAILAVSELKRPQHGSSYAAGGTAFKESGDIEYTAELALTLEVQDRTADDDIETDDAGPAPVEGPWVLLRVQYDREGRTGKVARYRSIFPHYGVEEAPLTPKLEVVERPKLCAEPGCDKPPEPRRNLCSGHRKGRQRGMSPLVSPLATRNVPTEED